MLDLSSNDCGPIPSSERQEDRRFVLVTNGRRRTVLDVLESPPGAHETTLGELASDIERLDRERGSDGDNDISKLQLLSRLHHVHLPMLDSAGLIEYDSESKRIYRLPKRLRN